MSDGPTNPEGGKFFRSICKRFNIIRGNRPSLPSQTHREEVSRILGSFTDAEKPFTSLSPVLSEEQLEQARKHEAFIADNRINPRGPLGMTAEDHHNIGSTPPDILEQNPGKTRADFMSDAEIERYLDELRQEIEKFSSYQGPNIGFAQDVTTAKREHMRANLLYLKRIGRLPDKFRDKDKDINET